MSETFSNKKCDMLPIIFGINNMHLCHFITLPRLPHTKHTHHNNSHFSALARCPLITSRMPAGHMPVLRLLKDNFEVFCLTGVARCTNGNEILCEKDQLLRTKSHPHQCSGGGKVLNCKFYKIWYLNSP